VGRFDIPDSLLWLSTLYSPPSLPRTFSQVMLGTSDNSVVVIDENEVEDQLLQDRISAPITKMSVAPNGRFLACYRRDGVLTVMSTTFTTKVREMINTWTAAGTAVAHRAL
jgi:hypothetical protein